MLEESTAEKPKKGIKRKKNTLPDFPEKRIRKSSKKGKKNPQTPWEKRFHNKGFDTKETERSGKRAQKE